MTQVRRDDNGKKYEYDYKLIYISTNTHGRLRKLAKENKQTTSKTIDNLIKIYEGIKKNYEL
jgi:hypothetical protein